MTKVLVVVDYQKDFVDGALPCGPKAKAIEDKLYDHIKKCRDEGYLVIFTRDTHYEDEYLDTSEGKQFPIHCVCETDGWQIYGKVAELVNLETMYLEDKYTVMHDNWFGFFEWAWDDGFVKIDSIEVCGLDIAYCVFQNALALVNLWGAIPVTVNLDISATFNPALARFCVDYMKTCGIKIVGDLEGN